MNSRLFLLERLQNKTGNANTRVTLEPNLIYIQKRVRNWMRFLYNTQTAINKDTVKEHQLLYPQTRFT